MYINYNTVNGIEYGTLTSSVRNGSRVGKSDQVYLGRVVDKEKGIFKNRTRGLFTYDLATNSFGKVSADYIECDYEEKEGSWTIYHTEVHPDYANKGIAKRLVFKLVEEAERRKMKIIPVCSYAVKVLK